MTIYFAWINQQEIFDPQKHAQDDLTIFHLSIQQKENGFAFARLIVPWGRMPKQKYAFLSYRKSDGAVVLLFKGRLLNIPQEFDDHTMQIELTAQPHDNQEQLQQLHQALKNTPYWDPLFVPLAKRDLPSESLENRTSLYCWSRTTEKVTLSDIFQGNHVKNIGKNIWNEILKISCTRLPLEQITVHLEAQWVQHHQAIIDIGRFLKQHLPNGMISSFTGTDLQQRWPLVGQSLYKSGYRVLYSHLKEREFSNEGYPTISPPLKESNKTNHKQVYFKRFWFQPELMVAWQYFQKRRETVKITLKNSVQTMKESHQKQPQIFLKLSDVCSDRPIHPWKADHAYGLYALVTHQGKIYRCQQSGVTNCPPSPSWVAEEQTYGLNNPGHSTFFLTDRGYQAVAHAIDIARAHLAASSRAIKITFKTNWDVLSDISLDHTLTITDDRLPYGTATGKVVEYQFVAEEQKKWLSIVLLCAIGKSLDKEVTIPPVSSLYSQEGYLQPEKNPVTPCGIAFARFDHQSPKEGILAPWKLKIHDFIHRITIENTAEQQLEIIQKLTDPINISKEFKKIPTKIHFPLKSLATKHCLNHTITVDVPDAWAPPCHLLLTEK